MAEKKNKRTLKAKKHVEEVKVLNEGPSKDISELAAEEEALADERVDCAGTIMSVIHTQGSGMARLVISPDGRGAPTVISCDWNSFIRAMSHNVPDLFDGSAVDVSRLLNVRIRYDLDEFGILASVNVEETND